MDNKRQAVRDNYARIASEIAEAAVKSGRKPEDIAFMAVTKTVDPALVNEAIDCGISLLGENRVQEWQSKREAYRAGVPVDFIGALQSNKVKYLMGQIRLIHSVDRLSLAQEIERQAEKHGIVQDILLEVNIGGEESKSGTAPSELPALLEQVKAFAHVNVKGLMTIPPPCSDDRYLAAMEELFLRVKATDPDRMQILSMGMSDDYAAAILHGSNLVRVGSALFGARDYSKVH
ncbi:MAG: YggS family pyridoxal phosphate-dependent enzyme [Oscillospiraceae bacterium]|nr:YggS family pyridoxal phosphate-dependent enzyme [Oscillospiraceae bacterium]